MSEEIEYLEYTDDSILVWDVMNTGRRSPRIWPFCAKLHCKNRTYRNSDYCYPHTIGRAKEIEQLLKESVPTDL